MFSSAKKREQAWRPQAYPVPMPSKSGVRWKASLLRMLHRWHRTSVSAHPVTIMVPALHNLMPAESVALGWLTEIDALVAMRQRMNCAAGITGWDVFTFHTLHNADRYFDSTIAAMRETWLKEGNLSSAAVEEARRRFANPYDYHRVHARLVENLVFQSSLLDWIDRHASELPLRIHVVGTALLSALVSARSISFNAAVESATKFGSRWDRSVREMSNGKTEDEVGWSQFRRVRRMLEGVSPLSLTVDRKELPAPEAPAKPFWYSTSANSEAALITTAQDAMAALESMNIASWSYLPARPVTNAEEPVRGWLVSPLHPMAKLCRWSVSNYLLATPSSVTLFLDHIATLARNPVLQAATDPAQNRLRLSRMKVTGP